MKKNHSTVKIQVRELPPIIKKMLENKKLMQAYSRGEITKAQLIQQGIHLVNPL